MGGGVRASRGAHDGGKEETTGMGWWREDENGGAGEDGWRGGRTGELSGQQKKRTEM